MLIRPFCKSGNMHMYVLCMENYFCRGSTAVKLVSGACSVPQLAATCTVSCIILIIKIVTY